VWIRFVGKEAAQLRPPVTAEDVEDQQLVGSVGEVALLVEPFHVPKALWAEVESAVDAGM
jgi:hypothetical protein